MSKPSVSIRKSDYARALGLAEKFNIKAHDRPNRKVKAVLKEAVAFLQEVKAEIKNGNAIETGSAWHGPDPFLDQQSAVELARKKDRADYLTGDVSLSVAKRDADGLGAISKAFGLSSKKQAATLALRVYERIVDGLWRGNGFHYANANAPALDTDKIKHKQFPHTR